jgi:cell wall-associated NlpC family hydrolase
MAARRRRTRIALVAALAALVAAGPAAAANPIAEKQAEAQAVLAQVNELDATLERAIEAYDLANVKLGGIERDLRTNHHELVVARGNLAHSQRTLERRLVALYTSGEQTNTMGVLLGSSSLDDLVSRLDNVGRVSDQDARVVEQVLTFRSVVRKEKRRLDHAHALQRQVVAERAARRSEIDGQLAERRQLLASIQSEIVRMQAEEARRQALLARQIQAHLAAQQRAEQAAVAQTVVGVTAATPDGSAAVAPPSQYGGVVGTAMQYLGTPYHWGGSGPGGFDCSGLVEYVYAQHGVSLPHNAAAQFSEGTPVDRSQLAPGDLVFFNGLGHVGIYVGNGEFIHAPHTGDVVKISSLDSEGGFVGARRIG